VQAIPSIIVKRQLEICCVRVIWIVINRVLLLGYRKYLQHIMVAWNKIWRYYFLCRFFFVFDFRLMPLRWNILVKLSGTTIKDFLSNTKVLAVWPKILDFTITAFML